jgi:hypothetical protein
MSALALVHPNLAKPFQVETDASDFALGAILSQLDDDGTLHPVAYYSRKFSASEINYPVYDKELAAIISAFTEWRPYLAGAQHHIQVVTDHKNLLYFASSRTLNRRQARWSIFLADYDFEIIFRPGIQHGKADALSGRPDLALCPGDDAHTQQSCSLLKPDQLQLSATFMLHDDSLLQEIAQATKMDTFATKILKRLQDSSTAMKQVDLHHFSAHDGLLYHSHLLYVPERSTELKCCKHVMMIPSLVILG